MMSSSKVERAANVDWSASEDRGANSKQIGARLRALRGEREFTILELAARAAVSAGMISQIERGQSNPSIKTLQRLCRALDLNVWEFLEKPSGRAATDTVPFVRRSAQRPRLIADSGIVKELLSPQYAENLRFMFVTLPPGGQTEEVLIGPGQKAGYVIAGSVELTVGDSSVTLDVGDSFQFGSSADHKLTNPSEVEARVLWIISVLDVRL